MLVTDLQRLGIKFGHELNDLVANEGFGWDPLLKM